MKFHYTHAGIGAFIGLIIGVVVAAFVPAAFSFIPDSYTVTKSYHDCNEPGLFNTGKVDGNNCYDTVVELNEPYKTTNDRIQISIVVLTTLGNAIYFGIKREEQ